MTQGAGAGGLLLMRMPCLSKRAKAQGMMLNYHQELEYALPDGDVQGPALVTGWKLRTYLLVFALAGLPAALCAAVGMRGEAIMIPLVLGGVPLLLLTLFRPVCGLYLLILLAPFESFGQLGHDFTMTKAVGLFTVMVFLAHLAMGRIKVPGSAPLLLVIAFAFWSLVTVVAWTDTAFGLRGVLTRFQVIGLFIVVLGLCRGPRELETLFWVFLLGSVVAGAAGLVMTPDPEWESMVKRAHIGNIGANQLAKTMFSGLFLAPYLFTKVKKTGKFLVIVAVLVMLISLVKTGSRSGYIAIVIGFSVALMTYRPLSLGKRLAILFTCVLVLVGTLVIFATVLSQTRLGQHALEGFQAGTSSGGRMRLWTQGLKWGFESPLVGIGINHYIVRAYGSGNAAHNDFIQHFAELGFPGLILYLAFLASVLSVLRRTSIPILRSGIYGLFVAAVLMSMANPSDKVKIFWVQLSVCVLAGMVFGSPYHPFLRESEPEMIEAQYY